MTFIPHTQRERDEMLAAIGCAHIEELFADIPSSIRYPRLELPDRLSEPELARTLKELADRNQVLAPEKSFLGGGCYRHYIPATVDFVLQRAEFYTSYTPYQPELSQGMLQAMFEYQTMICQLTGMEVANASHYDGATSLAEACLLALNLNERTKIALAPGVNPRYRDVVETYLAGHHARIVTDSRRSCDQADLADPVDEETAALVVQTPNFFGQFEGLDGLAENVHAAGALLIVVTDPISLGLFRPPGEYGADIAVLDGQSLGLPVSFGGPHLGVFATRTSLVRRMAGRVVGQTTDAAGRRGYVLTLATREQHIRRERATSNICTNAALSALAASVYLATLGAQGLTRVARLCHAKAHYAADQLAQLDGCVINRHVPDKPFFKEFALSLPKPVAVVNRKLLDDYGIIGGYDLSAEGKGFDNAMLVSITELHSRAAINQLVSAVRDICA